MPETVLITGASSGIGYDLSLVFAKNGYNLVVVARSEDKLNELSEKCQKEFGVKVNVITKDLSVFGSAKEILDTLITKEITIDILVNNAGFGDYGRFIDTDINREKLMIDLNIISLTEFTKVFVKEMSLRKKGKILNVASIGGFLPGPKMSVYFATKAYVLSFTEAISEEMKNSGVSLSVLCPGPTKTSFFDEANFSNEGFKFVKYAESMDVAKFAYDSLMTNRTVHIHGFMNKLMMFFIRLVPRKLVRYLSASTMK